MSGALKRLRQVFSDELFVRTSRGMVPTPRALELAARIGPLLAELQKALGEHPSFDPATSTRVFRVGPSDSLEVALLPALLERLARVAPGLRLISRLLANGAEASALLDAGEAELSIAVLQGVPAWQHRRALFDWTFVCLFDARHVKTRGPRISLANTCGTLT